MTTAISHKRYLRSAIAAFFKLCVGLALLAAGIPVLAQTTSTWSTGMGAGNWSPCPQDNGTALWDTCSGDNYPDGNYNAVINGGPVTANYGFTIVNLSVGANQNLIVTPGYVDITGTSVINNGVITVGPGDGFNIIGQGQTVTLSGNGTVNLTGPSSNFDGTAGSYPTLINQQKITGQGTLGKEGMSVVNQGTINAVGGLLTVQVPPTGSITNTSLLEASNGATLSLIAPVTNTGGTIEALNGGIVSLNGNITGGILTTIGTGVIQPSGDTALIGLTNTGTVQVTGTSALLENTVTNNGTIEISNGTLYAAGTVTLQGSGSLLLTNASSNLEQNLSSVGPSGGSLISQQLIHGGGTLYDLPLTNQATIEADNATVPLYVSTATTNTGTMEASGGAQLVISNGITVNNTGGTIDALAGSSVLLVGTVSGGTIKNTGTGVMEGENVTLDGTVNVPTIAGIFKIPGEYDTTLEGTVNNTGTIEFLGSGGCLYAGTSTTTLTGDGKVILGTNNCIYGSGNTFINDSTIEGSGEIGDSNPMPIINNGTFLANKSTPLRIAPNSGGFTNNGKLTVSRGGVMFINTIGGPFNNLVGGMLTGGSYLVTGMLQLGGAITTNGASITLTGSAAEIQNTSSGGSALANLSANTTKGVLSLQSGQALVTGSSFTNAGKATVGAGSSFTVGGTYTQTAGTTTVDGTLTAAGLTLQKGTVEGKGTLAGAVTSEGTLTVGDAITKAGVLTINGTYTQSSTGILDTAIGGTTVGTQYSQLAVSNGVSLGGTLSLKLIGGFVPAVGDTFTIVTGTAVSGQFTTVKGTTINSGEHFEVNYGPTSVTVEVVSGT